MIFENWMSCEKLVDDGDYTIGYIDGKPAQWDGKNELLEGEDFRASAEGDTFGVNSQCDYVVKNGTWVKMQHLTASQIGKIGGSKKSEAKTAASRENGKKGGRPKKVK